VNVCTFVFWVFGIIYSDLYSSLFLFPQLDAWSEVWERGIDAIMFCTFQMNFATSAFRPTLWTLLPLWGTALSLGRVGRLLVAPRHLILGIHAVWRGIPSFTSLEIWFHILINFFLDKQYWPFPVFSAQSCTSHWVVQLLPALSVLRVILIANKGGEQRWYQITV